MPRPRYENLEAEKKQRLMNAAMKEFGQHGYEVASINRILDDAGFSKGSFYYYFDDKLDLAVATLLHAAGPLTTLTELRDPTTVDAFWSELRDLSIRRLRELEVKRLEFDAVTRLASAMAHNVELAARVMPIFAPGRMRMMQFLNRGVELGALRTDISLPTFMAVLEAAKTAAFKTMFPTDRAPSEAELESFTDFMLDLARRVGAPMKGEKS